MGELLEISLRLHMLPLPPLMLILHQICGRRHRSGQSATAGHGGGWQLWKKLSFFVPFPGVALCMLNVYLGAMQEEVHQVPFVPYEHMRLRSKRFPWGEGQKSLFHNPHVNALPDGYEHSEEH